jgi:RsiW-degrading membrane proteinase PrsW (M82 family)
MQLFKPRPLKFYVIAVIIVLVIVLALRYFILGPSRVSGVFVFCAGFLLGMFGMFVAANLYRSPSIWKSQNRLNAVKDQPIPPNHNN